MTKKFISLLISVIMVVGLIPTMSVSVLAEDNPKVLYNDFESYAEGQKFNEDFNKNTKDNYIGQIYLGVSTMGEIITMEGYDGNTTKALKISTNPDATWSTTTGGGRLNYTLSNAPTTGIYVTELKVYVPKDVDSGGQKVSRTFYRLHGKPFILTGSKFGAGTAFSGNQYDASYTYNQGEWYKLTYVQDLDAGVTSMFVNDNLVSEAMYHYSESGTSFTSTTTQMQIYSRNDDDTYGSATKEQLKEKHIIFDDFNFYVPQITTVSSVYSDGSNVNIGDNITVDFSQRLLDATINSVKTVSKANVLMTESDGTTVVPLTSVTVGTDKKSIVIDPEGKLVKGMKYNVKVTGLYDIYDNQIDDYTFSFTTMEESKISCAQPTFKKENLFVYGNQGTTITALENGYIRTDLTVSNRDTAEKEVFVIALLKENGDIKGFQFDEVTVPASGSADFNCSFQVDDAANQTIETFVWDSFSGKSPLASKWTFSNSGCTETVIEDQ